MRVMSIGLAQIIKDFDRQASRNPLRNALAEETLSGALDRLYQQQEILLRPDNTGKNKVVPYMTDGRHLVSTELTIRR